LTPDRRYHPVDVVEFGKTATMREVIRTAAYNAQDFTVLFG
jgi:hypothetical protein